MTYRANINPSSNYVTFGSVDRDGDWHASRIKAGKHYASAKTAAAAKDKWEAQNNK